MGESPNNPKADLRQTATSIVATYWPLIIIGLLFVVIQSSVLADWWNIWMEKDGYYSHGPLVPFIAGFMVWMNRHRLARTQISNSWFGLVLLLAFLPTHVIGLLMGLRVLYGVAFFLCVYGALLLLLGSRMTRILFIPVLFLLTMMPVASWMLDNATGSFQLISAAVATKFLQLTSGYDAVQYGNSIKSSGLPELLLIGSPCSGLRLLISLFTFSWFFVYAVNGAWWKKVVLLALSFPLSIFINSLRITMIGFVGFWTYSPEAMHKFHDYSGYIGLVVCFVILFGIAKLLGIGDFRVDKPDPADASDDPRPKLVGGGRAGLTVVLVFVIGAVSSGMISPLYSLPKGHVHRENVPMSFGTWTGRDLPIDKGTRIMLHKGDLLSRAYTDAGDTGREVYVFIDAGVDLSAFHDPHLCLPGGGTPITKDRVITLSLTKPRPITVKASIIKASGDNSSDLVLYWYMAGERSYPRTEDIGQVNRANRLDDLARVIRRPWDLSDLRRDINSRQFVWYRFNTEVTDDVNDEAFLRKYVSEFIADVRDFGAQ